MVEAEPLCREDVAQRVRFRIREHPVDLLQQNIRLVQLVPRCQIEELVVGHRSPQEIGQARGQLVTADAKRLVAIAARFDSKQKFRRDEHRSQHLFDRFFEVLTFRAGSAVVIERAVQLSFVRRAPIGARKESRNNLLRGTGVGSSGDEDAVVGTPMRGRARLGRQCQVDDAFGGRDVAFHQRGLQEECIRRVVEPARAAQLLGEPCGGIEIDPEQVAKGVVIFGVGQASHGLEPGIVHLRVVEVVDRLTECFEHPVPLDLGGLRHTLGRHQTHLESGDHPAPRLAIAHERLLGAQRLQVDSRLRRFLVGTVAPEAVLLEQGPFRQSTGRTLGDRGPGRHQSNEEDGWAQHGLGRFDGVW